MNENILVETYIRLKKKFFSKAYLILNNREDANDALQEAFYKLWKRGYDLDNSSNAEAIITTAVKNVSIDMKKKIKEKSIDYTTANFKSEETNLRDKVEKERLLSYVDKIIDNELSELQKYIINKKEYEGKTLEEVAKELNMNSAAVRMQLSRARKKIRECYLKQKIDG